MLGMQLAALALLPCLTTFCPVEVVDADTLRLAGVRIRVDAAATPIDAPGTYRPACPAEGALGRQASARTAELVRHGVRLQSRGFDQYGRVVAVAWLPTGGDLGSILLAEGLAKPTKRRQRRPKWCE